jgi:hypothetical protein
MHFLRKKCEEKLSIKNQSITFLESQLFPLQQNYEELKTKIGEQDETKKKLDLDLRVMMKPTFTLLIHQFLFLLSSVLHP